MHQDSDVNIEYYSLKHTNTKVANSIKVGDEDFWEYWAAKWIRKTMGDILVKAVSTFIVLETGWNRDIHPVHTGSIAPQKLLNCRFCDSTWTKWTCGMSNGPLWTILVLNVMSFVSEWIQKFAWISAEACAKLSKWGCQRGKWRGWGSQARSRIKAEIWVIAESHAHFWDAAEMRLVWRLFWSRVDKTDLSPWVYLCCC